MPGLLLVIAHPDDEIFCSGLLVHLTSKEVPLHIVCLTRGEGGQLGSPPRATPETLASVREKEMERAAKVIGADSLVFLDYVDPPPDGSRLRAPDHDPQTLEHEIAIQINKFDPEVVLTHGSTGDYGHPAHVLVHKSTKGAVQKVGGTLYSFNAFFPGSGRMRALNRNDWATLLFDGSTYTDARFESFWKHETQWSVFVGEQDSEADYRQALTAYFQTTAVESYCRQLVSESSTDLLPSWCDDFRREPPNSGRMTRIRYRTVWKLRDFARKVKRRFIV